jgi:hypothetical protein
MIGINSASLGVDATSRRSTSSSDTVIKGGALA